MIVKTGPDHRLHTVVFVQAAAHCRQLHFHNEPHRLPPERAINYRLETRQQRRLEVLPQQRIQQFLQIQIRGRRPLFQQLYNVIASEISGHQDNGVAKVDFPAFPIAHKTAIEHLVKKVHDVAVRFFYLVEQNQTIRTFSDGFRQYAALAEADITRRRPLKLRNRMRFLIL